MKLNIFFSLMSFVKCGAALSRPYAKTNNRRAFWTKTIAMTVGPSLVACSSQPAFAIKERNDMLCDTGFFTNIAQWYCTDLGDISDEGATKELSRAEQKATDALLFKMQSTIETKVESTKTDKRQIKDESKVDPSQ
jgi:hypothetical protein